METLRETRCDYCRGPVLGGGCCGRPQPGEAAACYCCYGCLTLGEARREPSHAVAPVWWRLILAGVLAGQGMLLGLAVNLSPDEDGVRLLLQCAVLLTAVIVTVLLGIPLARAAVREISSGRVTVEALFLLTMLGAAGASFQSMVRGRGPIYFEVISILLVVYTLNKLIGARTRAAALAATTRWSDRLQSVRRIDVRGQATEVPIEQIGRGDLVEVQPGEWIPIDGTVAEGTAFIREASLTGEPFARVRLPGDEVWAGCTVEDATLRIRATSTGATRRIDALLQAVGQAREVPVSLQRQADRLARVFLPIVLGTAILTFLGWTWTTDWETGLFRAMSVLLVACPCALGLATPIAVWTALGQMAERGLLLRGADQIERLASVTEVYFDKTGTLTDDHAEAVQILTAPGQDRPRLLGWLAAIERLSSHPVARAMAAVSEPARLEQVRLEIVPGAGLIAHFQDENLVPHQLRIGRPAWLVETAPAMATTWQPPLDDSDPRRQQIGIELDHAWAALAIVTERLRDTSRAAVAELEAQGLPVELLTGDQAARAIAWGFPAVRAGMSPEEKRLLVAAREAAGQRCLFVGDGVNDAAALATASCGIALSSGSDLAVAAAPATLFQHDLRLIPWAIQMSRGTLRTIRQNLYGAAAYNLFGMAVAAAGWLHPVAAAGLMVTSSLVIAWRSASLGAGVLPHCGPGREIEPTRPAWLHWKLRRADLLAGLHALAIIFQAGLLVLLVQAAAPRASWEYRWIGPGGMLPAGAVWLLSILIGIGTAWLWRARPNLSYAVDMSFAMLTLGNLGMLAGWLGDVWWGAGAAACHCGTGSFTAMTHMPGMFAGMFLAATPAMQWATHRSCPWRGWSRAACWMAENLGMLLGMLAGHALLTGRSVLVHAAVMTLGMLAGMLAGHFLVALIRDWWIATRLGESAEELLMSSDATSASSPATVATDSFVS